MTERYIDIVFETYPHQPNNQIFVEVESPENFSVSVGKWITKACSNYSRLRITESSFRKAINK